MKLSSLNYPVIVTVAGLVAGFLLFNLVTPFMLDHMVVGMAFIGCVIGQLNLIASWAALAPGHIAVRVPWAMLLAVFMWFALIVGSRWESPYIDRANVIMFGGMLLIGVVAAQIPLWIARLAFGWRLQSIGTNEQSSQPRDDQFQVKHLLIGMTLLSLALAPIRLIIPEGEWFSEYGPPLGEWLGVMAVLIFFNLTLTLPAVWGSTMGADRLVVGCIAWLFYCLVLTIVKFGVFSAILGTPPDTGEAVVGLFLLNLVQGLTVLVGLLALRAVGFRMIRLPKTSPPVE